MFLIKWIRMLIKMPVRTGQIWSQKWLILDFMNDRIKLFKAWYTPSKMFAMCRARILVWNSRCRKDLYFIVRSELFVIQCIWYARSDKELSASKLTHYCIIKLWWSIQIIWQSIFDTLFVNTGKIIHS